MKENRIYVYKSGYVNHPHVIMAEFRVPPNPPIKDMMDIVYRAVHAKWDIIDVSVTYKVRLPMYNGQYNGAVYHEDHRQITARLEEEIDELRGYGLYRRDNPMFTKDTYISHGFADILAARKPAKYRNRFLLPHPADEDIGPDPDFYLVRPGTNRIFCHVGKERRNLVSRVESGISSAS